MNRRELIKALGFSEMVNEVKDDTAADSEPESGKPGPVYLVDPAMIEVGDLITSGLDGYFVRLKREFQGTNILPLPITRIDSDVISAVHLLKELLNKVKS